MKLWQQARGRQTLQPKSQKKTPTKQRKDQVLVPELKPPKKRVSESGFPELRYHVKTNGLFHTNLGLNIASFGSCNALVAKHERRVKALQNLYMGYTRG